MRESALKFVLMLGWIGDLLFFLLFVIPVFLWSGLPGWGLLFVLWSLPALTLIALTRWYCARLTGIEKVPSYRRFLRKWSLLVLITGATVTGIFILSSHGPVTFPLIESCFMAVSCAAALIGTAAAAAVTLYSLLTLAYGPEFFANAHWSLKRLYKCISGVAAT